MQSKEMKEQVTNRIVEQLEQGVTPWRQSWAEQPMQLPRNGYTGRAYRGINTILLFLTAIQEGFKSHHWFTVKQANDYEAKIKKGSKGTRIYFFNTFTKVMKDNNGNIMKDENGEDKEQEIPYWKTWNVFNADQIEGLPEHFYQVKVNHDALPESERMAEAETFISNTGANIQEGAGSPAYIPARDVITIPCFADFEHPEGYYSTTFHELGHWTKAPKRLNRELKKSYGKNGYAMEEMVAEMTAVFCCAHLGINSDFMDDNPAYIAHWLEAMKNDYSAFYDAAKDAQAAFDFLLECQDAELQKAA